jgi:FkbM family methyltransferase
MTTEKLFSDSSARHITDKLKTLSTRRAIPQGHVAYLWKLKDDGFEPRVIYDIGACVLHWTTEAQIVWPDATIIAFEAMEHPRFIYEERGVPYHIGVLTDRDNVVLPFYENPMFPGGNSYYREIGSPASATLFDDASCVMKTGSRLDTVVESRGFPPPDLIKIDVQGSELDVLRGATKTLESVTHLIVELQHTHYNKGAPLASTSMPEIEAMGFECVAPLFHNNGADGDYGFRRRRN